MSNLSRRKIGRFSIDQVTHDMNKPRQRSLAFLLRVRIYDGDALKPKIQVSLPLPLLFCLSIGLDVFACIVSYFATIVLYFMRKKKNSSLIKAVVGLIGRGFFLTRLSYALMRHGGRFGICAIDGNQGVIIYGA